jgi:polyisoprenoid-binding protein YceI
VIIKGTSTLHEWTMEGTTINGTVDTDPDTWRTAGEKPAMVSVTIPVASIKSDHAKMDDLMRDALKSKAHPAIRYEMSSGRLTKATGGDSFIVRTNGKLSMAGMTRDVTMDVAATRLGDGRYLLAGELPVHMKDYGVKPPTAMLGTIKAGPDVTITFRWVVARG